MKTIVIGDTHGKSLWKLITEIEDADRVIFIGDYFDAFDISGVEQIHNFKEIIEYKKTSGKEVILLIGNHDLSYWPGINGSAVSGYQRGIALNIQQVLVENKEHLQMCYQMDEFLFSHAGISQEWLNSVIGVDKWGIDKICETVNELWLYKPLLFEFNGLDPYGDNLYQTPVWIRPLSLMRAGKMDKQLYKKYIQVVGHTRVKMIDIKGKATGGRYYFIDTLDSSKEYLIINDGVVSVKNI